MEHIQTVSRKTLAILMGVVVLLIALGVGGYYVWQGNVGADELQITTDSTLTGTVVYRERIALPPGSSLVVQLLDITESETEPVLIAEQTIITRGENVPIAYAIPYNQSQILPDRQYVVEASILAEGDLYFATTAYTPVLTADAQTGNVDLLLVQNGTRSEAGTETPRVEEITLPGSVWSWVRTDNDPLASVHPVVAPVGNEYVLTFRESATFNSTTDCNRIAGSFAKNGEVLSFGSISMTEMACPDSLDTLYAAELGRVTSYVISGNELRLILQQDTGVMIFERQGTEAPILIDDEVVENPDEPVSSEDDDEGVMCTMDAMECPDGSYVGRIPPSCSFAACPGQ